MLNELEHYFGVVVHGITHLPLGFDDVPEKRTGNNDGETEGTNERCECSNIHDDTS